MHGIYTNGHHLSLIYGRWSENAALNPITSRWQSPTVVRRREEDREKEREREKRGRDKEYSTVRGGGGSVGVLGADWTAVQ